MTFSTSRVQADPPSHAAFVGLNTVLDTRRQCVVLFDKGFRLFEEFVRSRSQGFTAHADSVLQELHRLLPGSKTLPHLVSGISKRFLPLTIPEPPVPEPPVKKPERSFSQLDNAAGWPVVMKTQESMLYYWKELLRSPQLYLMRDGEKNTIVHKAFCLLPIAKCKTLLKRPKITEIIDEQNEKKETALHCVARKGRLGKARSYKIQLLLAHGAKTDIKDKDSVDAASFPSVQKILQRKPQELPLPVEEKGTPREDVLPPVEPLDFPLDFPDFDF